MIIDTIMYNGEADMLAGRLETLAPFTDFHVIVESPVTHRGVPKPLHYALDADRFRAWHGKIIYVAADLPDDPDPWVREHAQRDAAWRQVDALASDGDRVLICDVDEFPSAGALAWEGRGAVSLWMRTALFAVDWVVPPSHPLPPTAVMATAGWLRKTGGSLARARDKRGIYPVIQDGGWHFSWIGGPEAQAAKLDFSTCHREIGQTPEAGLIRSGARWRTDESGGGIPVVPAEVDETWPAFIRERRCPEAWFRPQPHG